MDDFAQKLRRLGVSQGRLFKPKQDKTLAPPADLPAGHEVETPLGRAFYVEERFPLNHIHGQNPLGRLLTRDSSIAAWMLAEPRSSTFDPRRALFIDTETTGLGGGVGVLPFLSGWGCFEDEHFIVRQYFLRDPDQEAATLHHLAEWTQNFDGLVSFNGRGFDAPILQNRFILTRLRPSILNAPHLDLLPPARRMWRGRLDSCALGSLERYVLGVVRDQSDVPGYIIPDLYRDYLRSGDANQMHCVFYHNLIDILSLVSLADLLCGLLAAPLSPKVAPDDKVALAAWHERLGMAVKAEQIYRAALQDETALLSLDAQHIALRRLAALLKRQDRRAEAAPLWAQLAFEDQSSIEAHVELAKFYEWHSKDLKKATAWTTQALCLADAWSPDLRREQARADLGHRLGRLERKQAGSASFND